MQAWYATSIQYCTLVWVLYALVGVCVNVWHLLPYATVKGLTVCVSLTESVPVACSRVEALRCHGYTSEARRLAVAVARGIKFHQQRRLSHGRPMHSYYSSVRSVHRRGQCIQLLSLNALYSYSS